MKIQRDKLPFILREELKGIISKRICNMDDDYYLDYSDYSDYCDSFYHNDTYWTFEDGDEVHEDHCDHY
jgi:hypothetical protein